VGRSQIAAWPPYPYDPERPAANAGQLHLAAA
jgi:hypothetical protein